MAIKTSVAPVEIKLGNYFDDICYYDESRIPVFKIFIAGKWSKSSDKKTFDIVSPIDNQPCARAQQSSIQDVELAIETAYNSRRTIRDIPGIGRIEIFKHAAELLLEHKEHLASTLTAEAGKPRADALSEVKATIDRMMLTPQEAPKIHGEYVPGDWAEDTTGKMALVIREPLGVIAAISSFNYPLYIAAAKIIPAILAGNTVVAKGASATPVTLLLYSKILSEAGIPPGVLNTITGPGAAIGDILSSSSKVNLVSLTGSTEVGKRITKIAGLKRLHLELGGKGMAVVLPDADLKLAAKKCVEGSFKNAGQRCDAVSAVLVVESIADEFVENLVAEASTWTFGDPRSEGVKVGPVISVAAAKRIHELIQDAVGKGAKLLIGGGIHGALVEPTILDEVPLLARIASEETFGPVVTIIRIKDENEAIELGKKSPYGLDSCVFTNDFYLMWKVAKGLEVGEVTINDLPRHGIGYFPFGGSKESGIGREGLGYSIDEMTNLKTIVFNLDVRRTNKKKAE